MKPLSLFCFVLTFLISTSGFANVVKIYTSVFPPIVTEDRVKPGYAYELIEEIFTTAKIPYEIIQLPWARAQYIAQTEPGSLIFPLTRTPTREENFNWGFELFKTQTHFITLNKVKMTPKMAQDKRIGVQLKSSWDNWLTEHQYPHIHRMTNEGYSIVRMLLAQRLDVWYAERSVAKNILPKMNIGYATFSDPVQVFETYLATNKDQPFEQMDKVLEAFIEIKESGRYHEIMMRYNIH